MKKKLLSLVMAVAMVLSLAIPAFAATNYYDWSGDTSKQDKNDQTLKFYTKMFVPTVKLTLPNLSTSETLVLNPYRIEYVSTTSAPATVNSSSGGGGSVASANFNEQVICPVYAIKNETNAKMNVKARAETSVSGNLTLVGASDSHVALNETATKAMINLVIKKTSVTSAEYAGYSIAVDSAMGKLNAYDTASNTVIKLQATNPEQKVATMKNASLQGGENYLLMQLDGELAREPSTPWTANDKFTTTVVFTFSPIAIGDAVGKYTNTTLSRTDVTTNTSIALPKAGTGGVVSEYGGFDSAANFKVNPDVSGWELTLNETDVKWSVFDAGDLGVTVTGSASAGYKLEIPAANQNKIQADGQARDYSCVLGFVDKYGVPRTLDVTMSLTRAAS